MISRDSKIQIDKRNFYLFVATISFLNLFIKYIVYFFQLSYLYEINFFQKIKINISFYDFYINKKYYVYDFNSYKYIFFISKNIFYYTVILLILFKLKDYILKTTNQRNKIYYLFIFSFIINSLFTNNLHKDAFWGVTQILFVSYDFLPRVYEVTINGILDVLAFFFSTIFLINYISDKLKSIFTKKLNKNIVFIQYFKIILIILIYYLFVKNFYNLNTYIDDKSIVF